jgi:hypothetical protein
MMRIREITKDYVTLEVSKKLVRQDYDIVVPELERLMAVNDGHLNVLLELQDFKGWEPQALGREESFDVKRRHDFGRVAVVGEKSLEKLATRVSAPLFSGEIRFFPQDTLGEARQWLGEPNLE